MNDEILMELRKVQALIAIGMILTASAYGWEQWQAHEERAAEVAQWEAEDEMVYQTLDACEAILKDEGVI